MELAILEYEQVAGPLGDREAIHTIIYYTKMYRLQSLYWNVPCWGHQL